MKMKKTSTKRFSEKPGSEESIGPLIQGYLAHKKPPAPRTLVGLCLGTYGGPMGVGISYERGTPVGNTAGGYMGAPVDKVTECWSKSDRKFLCSPVCGREPRRNVKRFRGGLVRLTDFCITQRYARE